MCFPREKLQTLVLCPCKFYPECNKSTLLGIFFLLSYSHKGQGRFHIDSSVPQVWGWSSLEILFPVSGFETPSCSPFSWSGCNTGSGSLASLFLFVLTSCYSTFWAIQQKSLKCYRRKNISGMLVWRSDSRLSYAEWRNFYLSTIWCPF